jgi:hypothetical protein
MDVAETLDSLERLLMTFCTTSCHVCKDVCGGSQYFVFGVSRCQLLFASGIIDYLCCKNLFVSNRDTSSQISSGKQYVGYAA